MENISTDFQEVIYENVRKNNIHFTTNIYIYIYIYIYMGHRHFKVLWSFIFHILLRFVLSLKSSNYAFIPPYMHKTLPTLGNEKEQLNFTKNHRVSWFSCKWLKISKCFISLAWLGKCSNCCNRRWVRFNVSVFLQNLYL